MCFSKNAGKREKHIEQTTNRTYPSAKNGLWEGQYFYERERRSIYSKTQEEVSQQLGEVIASIENGNYIRPNQHTLISWLREWLHTYAKPVMTN